jgi:ribosomal-protein-serine acetyltransferase
LVSIHIDEHILLRSYEAADAAALYEAVNASRAHLHNWLEWVDKTTKPEHSAQLIQLSLHQLQTQESLALGIFYDGRLIGGIGMHDWHLATKKAQAGYWISKDYEGQGIINKCMQHFITFLFEKIGLNKIELHFIPTNKRSAKVAERLGFKIEGIIRQSVIRNGVPADYVIAGLLKSEWKKTTPNP